MHPNKTRRDLLRVSGAAAAARDICGAAVKEQARQQATGLHIPWSPLVLSAQEAIGAFLEAKKCACRRLGRLAPGPDSTLLLVGRGVGSTHNSVRSLKSTSWASIASSPSLPPRSPCLPPCPPPRPWASALGSGSFLLLHDLDDGAAAPRRPCGHQAAAGGGPGSLWPQRRGRCVRRRRRRDGRGHADQSEGARAQNAPRLEEEELQGTRPRPSAPPVNDPGHSAAGSD